MTEHAIVIGMQWGDEGKGKISDYLSPHFDIACRFSGGDNAAHTVVSNGVRHVFRTLPAAVLRCNKVLIASHVIFDPQFLAKEIMSYSKINKKLDLTIDHRAHISLPYHREIDASLERWRGQNPLKSTGRGVGPCCADRTDRLGLRAGDLLNSTLLRRKLKHIVPLKARFLSEALGSPTLVTPQAIYSKLKGVARMLAPYIGDGRNFFVVNKDRHPFLFESSQGALLDITYGFYPYVAGYSTLSTAVFPSLGVPAFPLRIIGVMCAYTTQIGNAPFPTEQVGVSGRLLQDRGHENSADGYARRVGWLDLELLKYSISLNGVTELALTKLDVLDVLDKIPVCVGYNSTDRRGLIEFSDATETLRECTPIYVTLDGWRTSTRLIRQFRDLPRNARRYIEYIEESVGLPIRLISTGPDRKDTIVRNSPINENLRSER